MTWIENHEIFGFYDAMGDSVPQLSGSFWHWYFFECLQMLEVCLRSCCCKSAFDICMVHLVFFICGDGCILRTHRVLGKGLVLSLVWGWFHYYVMVYSWYAFRVVTCYSMFIWSMLSLLRWLDYVVMFLRLWLELWHWSWFSFLILSTLIIFLILHDNAMLQWSFAWNDWLQVLVDTWRLRWG